MPESVLDRFRLDGDTALVTGAASGIGRGINRAMADAGASVAIVDVDEAGLEETTASCEERDDVFPLTADVGEEREVERAVEETVDAFGELDAVTT